MAIRQSERAHLQEVGFVRSARRMLAVVVLVMLALSSTAAFAQESSSEAQSATKQGDMEAFKELVKEGAELRDAGKLFEARERLERARQILDHPRLTFGIGKLYQETGACKRAKDLYRDVLGRPKLPDDLRAEVVEQLETTDTCRDFGTLTLSCTPHKAQIEVGDKRRACPLRAEKVSPGELEMTVSAPGYEKKVVSVHVEAGERTEQHVELREASVSALEAPGQAGASTPWQTYAAYGAIGVGGALLAGGLASDWSAQSRAEEFVAANEAGDRSRAASLKEEADSAQLRTIGLYSAGAVLLGTGVALWVVDWNQEGDQAPVVRAEAGVGLDGASLRGVIRW